MKVKHGARHEIQLCVLFGFPFAPPALLLISFQVLLISSLSYISGLLTSPLQSLLAPFCSSPVDFSNANLILSHPT